MKKKKWKVCLSTLIFILFLILFFVNQICASDSSPNILFNEIMYDPFPDDLYNEWIELYNPTNQTVNLSGWMITDNYRTDTLEPDFDHSNGTTLLPPQGYAIITDKGTTMYENYTVAPNTISLYVDDNRIGNGLGNTKDKLILRDPNATVHDMIEWGDDYEDIPGFPINDIDENHTLSRYPNTDTDDTSEDFYDAIIPSPGTENIETVNETITIDMYPECVPKIPSTAEYSIPFAVHISLQNFSANTTYQIKPYVVGKSNSMYPASQYWNDSSWQYAFYYTPLQTNFEGSWSGWYYLRLKKEYQEYQNNIEHNSSAFFILKLKTNTTVYEHTKQLQVLDLDESTTNGTTGGYHVGLLTVNETLYDNSLLMMTNNTGAITSLYRSEDNSIDEGLIPIPGYFKLPSPTGENYTLQIIDDNGTCIQSISNITITSGDYALDISTSDSQFYLRRSQTITIPIHLSNTGTFTDTFTININQITPGWHAELNTTQITLESGQSVNISLHLIPIQVDGENNGQLTLYATSLADIGATSTLDLCFEIIGPDLLIPKIKCYDQYKTETCTVGQGEPLQIKAYIKNIGNENGGPFTVSFYYDKKDIQHHIETKKYDSITRYQKYPSITWDTTLVPAGKHTIYVVADSEEQLEERDETNNQNHILVNLTYTWQNNSKYLMITELYYHTHSTVKNEFITISNPSPFAVDISNWYITNTPEKQKTDQKKILFPSETTLRPYCSICLTQNASDFCWETGVSPDFEYLDDADKNIPQMHMKKTVTLSNKGGALALKDTYNHTIDMIVYGDTTYNGIGWNGVPVNDSGTAVILKRNKDTNAGFFDTNTSFDWDHPRRYGIGQSSFLYTLLNVSGNVTMFVSPDSSFPTIVSELCNATQSIDINMYEFTNPFLCDTLLSVLQKNITVRLFLEGSPIGGIDERERYILHELHRHGAQIQILTSIPENKVYTRYTFDHGKYVIIDNKTVIVESCNWAKTGIPKTPSFGNREWGIIIRNYKVAEYFLEVFNEDWNIKRCDSISYECVDLHPPDGFYPDQKSPSGCYPHPFDSTTISGNFTAIPVFSPDTSYEAILTLLDSAKKSIYIEQLYIYKDWGNERSPFVVKLLEKAQQQVDIRILLNYNPAYGSSNIKSNETIQFLIQHGIKAKFFYTNWSVFTNLHNKGVVVDNTSVLISSINWNENSVTRNREAGIIITNAEVAGYYQTVFLYDWNLVPIVQENDEVFEISSVELEKPAMIMIIYTFTFAIIIRDWRKREWNS